MLAFGLWWLAHAEAAARRAGETYREREQTEMSIADPKLRERSAIAGEFDLAEIPHGRHAEMLPSALIALLPLAVVIFMNLVMSVLVLPRLDTSFLADERLGGNLPFCRGGRMGRGQRVAGRDHHGDRA